MQSPNIRVMESAFPQAQLYRVGGRLVLAARNGSQLEIRRY